MVTAEGRDCMYMAKGELPRLPACAASVLHLMVDLVQQFSLPYGAPAALLMQDSLGGNARTLVIANINPSAACSAETNVTLGFALRARKVRNIVSASMSRWACSLLCLH